MPLSEDSIRSDSVETTNCAIENTGANLTPAVRRPNLLTFEIPTFGRRRFFFPSVRKRSVPAHSRRADVNSALRRLDGTGVARAAEIQFVLGRHRTRMKNLNQPETGTFINSFYGVGNLKTGGKSVQVRGKDSDGPSRSS